MTSMFVSLPTDEHALRPCETGDDDTAMFGNWGKLSLHTSDNGRAMRIATNASWLVNWILLFSKIAAVIVSNSKAVSLIVFDLIECVLLETMSIKFKLSRLLTTTLMLYENCRSQQRLWILQ